MVSRFLRTGPGSRAWGLIDLFLTVALIVALPQVSRGNQAESAAAGRESGTNGHRVLKEGTTPSDRRLGPLKNLDGYFPLVVPSSPDAWQARAETVRKQILVATGLWPMPTLAPLKPVIHGKIDRDEYTVEKVYFESYPGHFVTGNLYRPKGREGKLPGVLCPYGHWGNGRFQDEGVEKAKREIAQGAEKFENAGRFVLQARCVQLARMGCVVFHYDMVGRADSQQIPEEVGHFYAQRRPQMETFENWGFFTPQAELRLQSVMGLQTVNSLRSLDFLCELPDVDPSRIGVTGASGGGTQTFILCAIDPRPVVAFPAVMVSTAMQGGCTCENCSLLRIGTGNVEFAALFAPKPLGLTAANDWTRRMATKGGPELAALYRMLGAEGNVELYSMTQFGHNYNHPSREAMYQWFNRHLKLGLDEPVRERDFVPLSIQEMSVWDSEHPRPKGGEEYERSLLRTMTTDAESQMAALIPNGPDSLAKYRNVVGDAWRVMLADIAGDSKTAPPEHATKKTAYEYIPVAQSKHDTYTEHRGLLRAVHRGEELPLVRLEPVGGKSSGPIVLWITREGKGGLFEKDGELRPGVSKLLAAGRTVVGVDLLYQGEFLADGKPLLKTRRVGNDRDAACFTYGYNPSVFAYRVGDIVRTVRFLKGDEGENEHVVELYGAKGAGHLVAVAAAMEPVRRAAFDTDSFRFCNVPSIDHPDFLPGGAKYLDLPGVIAFAAPRPIFIRDGAPDPAGVIEAAYKSSGAKDQLTRFDGKAEAFEQVALNWLLGN